MTEDGFRVRQAATVGSLSGGGSFHFGARRDETRAGECGEEFRDEGDRARPCVQGFLGGDGLLPREAETGTSEIIAPMSMPSFVRARKGKPTSQAAATSAASSGDSALYASFHGSFCASGRSGNTL